MAVSLAEPGPPPLPAWALLGAGGLMSAGLASATWVAAHLHPDEALADVALFAHLASLVVGFGAVLAVDWVGLLWALGRRRLTDVVDTAGHVQSAIWVGLGGLLVSGVLLEPDPANPLTQVKLVLVLVVAWNGLLAGRLHRTLAGAPRGGTRRWPLALALLSAAVSQAGWWGAMVLGYLNH